MKVYRNTMMIGELRSHTENMMLGLIAGDVTPREASIWSEDAQLREENRALIESSKSLRDLLDSLAVSDGTHDGVEPMYNKESFQEWFDEYKREYMSEKSQRNLEGFHQ